MFEILFLLIGLFYLALPILIYVIFQKIKLTENRVNQLDQAVSKLEQTVSGTSASAEQAITAPVAPETPTTPEEPEAQPAVTPAPPKSTAIAKQVTEKPETKPIAVKPARPAPSAEKVKKAAPEPEKAPDAGPGWGTPTPMIIDQRIKAWLLGGNTVARIGVVILFFGVAFFLKYAVDRGWLPVELRIMAAAIGGMVLIVLGWRLRLKRHNYALILQGGGIGIVYLSVFAAVSLYQLMPTLPGLTLMVVLVALSSMLAIRQNARSLAVLACIGGFLAPVLISTEGSHITLFSYYAVLNVGILLIAWFKAWRELNLLGFIFTFVIASLWGYQYYQPTYFASVQPFLVLFVVLYVAIPILFAQRQPPDLKGYVDGPLVFGVPLVGFGLQSALVRDFEYGLALSAIILALFYAALATLLWRRRQENTRLLTETFIALSVAFGTVAIPLAVDGRWTGAAWALEGAALVWVGLRQERLLAQLSGLLIQLFAGAAFLSEFRAARADLAVLNSFYLSALMIGLAGLFSAYQLHRFSKLRQRDSQTAGAMLIWGLSWWFGAGLNEISVHLESRYHHAAALAFVALSLTVIALLRQRLAWSTLAYVLPLLLPAMMIIALLTYADNVVAHPFEHLGFPAWLLAFTIQYWFMRRLETEWKTDLNRYQHLGTFWLLLFVVTWELSWLVQQLTPETKTWSHVVWALIPALAVASLPSMRRMLAWPLKRFENDYLGIGLGLPVAVTGLWAVIASFQTGDPSPLIYLPALNPHEATQLFVLATAFLWLRRNNLRLDEKLRRYAWFTAAFLVMNGMIARAIHFYSDVPFTMNALWNSPRYQTSVSIIWTLAALLIMVVATRMKQRLTWLIGSILLGAVVVKLFLVDLADIGTIARIVSFIVVGLLILLIGYLSPMPPKTKDSA